MFYYGECAILLMRSLAETCGCLQMAALDRRMAATSNGCLSSSTRWAPVVLYLFLHTDCYRHNWLYALIAVVHAGHNCLVLPNLEQQTALLTN